jgi:3-oxoacyl-(acyl-carrier-protein) synthase
MSANEPRALVTGIGMVNPLGNDRETFWKRCLSGTSAIAQIGDRFDSSGLPVQLAAQVRNFVTFDQVPRRLAVKSDVFTHYAIAATAEALAHAGIEEQGQDEFRTGISFGNNSGGWDLCERGFREYYEQGPSMINPWQATAWFPTAAQGFTSIRYHVRGFSKSFACDRASGASALYYGLRSIKWRRNDRVLAGGAEAPITRLGVAGHITTGDLTRSANPLTAYRPFQEGRDGLVLGEGATVLVLEAESHTVERGASVLGELLAVEQRTTESGDPAGLESAIRAALAGAGREPRRVGAVFAEGAGGQQSDAVEAAALAAVFGPRGVPVTVPKAGYGHQYGASAATEVACALLMLRDQVIPATAAAGSPSPDCPVDLVTESRATDTDTVVVTSRSREGANLAIVLGAYQDDTDKGAR